MTSSIMVGPRSTPQPSKMDKLSPHGAAVVVLEGDEGDDELMTSPDDEEHEACGSTLPVEFVSLLFELKTQK